MILVILISINLIHSIAFNEKNCLGAVIFVKMLKKGKIIQRNMMEVSGYEKNSKFLLQISKLCFQK